MRLNGTAKTMGSYCGFLSGIMWSAGQERAGKNGTTKIFVKIE